MKAGEMVACEGLGRLVSGEQTRRPQGLGSVATSVFTAKTRFSFSSFWKWVLLLQALKNG